MTWREFRRATVQITARISAQPENVCDDRRVTTPRCIVNEDSGMRNFVKTNRATQKALLHFQRIQRNCPLEVTGQMASPRARARRRPTVTLGVLYSYRMPGFIQGWPQNYIASLWTQYSFCSPPRVALCSRKAQRTKELSTEPTGTREC